MASSKESLQFVKTYGRIEFLSFFTERNFVMFRGSSCLSLQCTLFSQMKIKEIFLCISVAHRQKLRVRDQTYQASGFSFH